MPPLFRSNDPNTPFSPFGTALSPPDDRDYPAVRAFSGRVTISDLPDEVGVENRAALPLIRDQWYEGTCMGQSAAAVKDGIERRWRTPSRAKLVPLFSPRGIYHNGQEQGGYVGEEGAYPRDVLHAMTKRGVPREPDWPYIPRWDNTGTRDIGTPSSRYNANAARWKIGAYYRVTSLEQIVRAVHTIGPIIMVMDVTESFMNVPSTGLVPSPSGENYGPHAMAIFGATISQRRLHIPNSWGTEWGDGGWCHMDWDDFLLRSDGEAWIVHDAPAS